MSSKFFGRTFRNIWTTFAFVGFISFIVWVGGFPKPADAYVPPRPTVELVKMFKCQTYDYQCPQDVENAANDWLQKQQPNIRIVARIMTSGERHLVLAIFYEVPEWRTKSTGQLEQEMRRPRAPAEIP